MKYLFYCLITPPPRGGPTPEIDPYEWHTQTVGVSQRRCDSKEKKKKNLWCDLDQWSHPRNWSEFIHEEFIQTISRHRIWSCRSEEVGDVVIGIARVLSSICEGSLDSGSDKAVYP